MNYKVLIFLLVLAACSLSLQNATFAVEEETEAHVFWVQTWKRAMPDGGSEVERDSLLKEWVESVTKKNDKIISTKNLVHRVGSDSRDWIVIIEYASWADIEAAQKITDELIEKKWPDEKDRKEFFDKLEKYFPDYLHTDEIYDELLKFGK